MLFCRLSLNITSWILQFEKYLMEDENKGNITETIEEAVRVAGRNRAPSVD